MSTTISAVEAVRGFSVTQPDYPPATTRNRTSARRGRQPAERVGPPSASARTPASAGRARQPAA
ncbi:MAG TPA: hypothetical protein VGM91_15685 [Conexibacter sp.]